MSYFLSSLSYVLRQRNSELDPHNSAGLASQKAAGILLPLPSKAWNLSLDPYACVENTSLTR